MTATPFTEAQVRRAVKGAKDAGMEIGAVEVTREGIIRILPPQDKPTENDVDKWFEARHAREA